MHSIKSNIIHTNLLYIIVLEVEPHIRVTSLGYIQKEKQSILMQHSFKRKIAFHQTVSGVEKLNDIQHEGFGDPKFRHKHTDSNTQTY